MKDLMYMRCALEEAKKAFEAGEVPVGAVIVYEGEVIAAAHNRVEALQDASAHAEMLCLREASRKLRNWRLCGATLYCTLEPCPMCAGAMILSRVESLVWGAPDLRHGANGSWTDLFSAAHPIHQLRVRGHVLQEESSALMKEFFKQRRKEKVGVVALLETLVERQQEKVLSCALCVLPHLTRDDLLQPNDFPELEHHPHFRHEEGVLEGMLSAKMACLAWEKDGQSS